MFKIIIFVYFFINLCGNFSFADNDYKIVVKVNKRIISNYDIRKEMLLSIRWVDNVIIFDCEKELEKRKKRTVKYKT